MVVCDVTRSSKPLPVLSSISSHYLRSGGMYRARWAEPDCRKQEQTSPQEATHTMLSTKIGEVWCDS